MLRKVFAIKEIKQFDDGSHEIAITTDSVDRDGDVIEVGGWDFTNYLKNPIVLLNHDSGALPIGQTLDLRVEPNAIVARFMFSTPANEFDPIHAVIARWNDGSLRAASVGFKPTAFEPLEEDAEPEAHFFGPFRFTDQELLEWSIVTIPANQDALRREFTKSLQAGAVLPVVNALHDEDTDTDATPFIALQADVIDDLHGAIVSMQSLYNGEEQS